MMNRGAPRDPSEVEDELWDDAQGDLAFDVGANMGQSVEKMVKRFHRVVAFEPALESFRLLDSEWKGDPHVTCERLALASHEGQMRLSVRQAPIQTGQLTALDMPYKGEFPGAPRMANWGEEIAQRSLPCTTLDLMKGKYGTPDFVKVDTEGGEAKVLQGAGLLLASGHPRWLIEFHTRELHDECERMLLDAGYAVETVRHPHYPAESHMFWNHGWLKAATEEST